MTRKILFFILLFNSCDLFAQDSLLGDGKQFGKFSNASKCSLDPMENIFVIDAATSELLKYSPERKFLSKTGGFGWSQQTFDHPHDMIAPNGLDVYVADYGNHRIQRFDRNLNFISSLSLRDNDDARQRFGYPMSIAMDRFGSLYIVDGENTRILKMNSDNKFERTFGGIEAGKGRLHYPSRIRVSASDRVYVQDEQSLVVFDIFGNYIMTLGNGLFKNIQTFAVDQSSVAVVDSCSLLLFNVKGSFVKKISLPASAIEHLCRAVDIDVQKKQLFILMQKEVIVYPFEEEIIDEH